MSHRSAYGCRLALCVLAAFSSSAAAPAATIDLRDLYDPSASAPLHELGEGDRLALAREADTEAGERPAAVDVQHYDLSVAVDPVAGSVQGRVTVTFVAIEDGLSALELDALDMQIEGASTDDGRSLSTVYDGELLAVSLPRPLAAGEAARVTIAYRAPFVQRMPLARPDATDPARAPAAFTYTQTEGSRTWYPCHDRPSDKATLTISVAVPRGFNALSNGEALAVERGPGGGAVFSYRMEQPIATYLVSLAVGQFEVLDIGSFRGKPLTVWTPAAIQDKALRETSRTQAMMEVFSEFTGVEYPFGHYAQSVAQSIKTSMEHQTATTMGGWRIPGDGSGETVVAHELAHHWFGDWVTCAVWGELWINEGFASYLPYVFYEATGEEPRALGTVDGWRSGYFAEARTTVRPLAVTAPKDTQIFDAHSYEKGALVLHHMRTTAGPAAFTRALKAFLTAHGGGNVVNTDLQAALEGATGRSWQDFFDQWVRSPGHPVLQASYELDAAASTVRLTIEQKQEWRLFAFPLTVEVIAADGSSSLHTVSVYRDRQVLELPVAGAPLAINLDPRWTLPAEITLAQSQAAWLAVQRHSPYSASRTTALRTLARLGGGRIPDAAAQALIAERALYPRTDALAVASADAANRPLVERLHRDLKALRRVDPASAGAIARAEEWLTRTRPDAPTTADETGWQARYLASTLVAERIALLGMLKHASLERSQAFGLEQLLDPGLATQERFAVVDLLTKAPTATTAAWILRALGDTSVNYRRAILTNLTAAGYDAPQIVDVLLREAQSYGFVAARAQMVELLGKQASSRERVCPELTRLEQAGLGDRRPAALASVRAAATAARAALACGAE